MPKVILFIVMTALSGPTAFAASVPDAVCSTPQVWDRGFEVSLTRLANGTYAGLVSELKMWGRIQRFQGPVQINVLSPSPSCELRVTSEDVSAGFDLRILESGNDQLLTVNDQSVNATESPMHCALSEAFSSDAAGFCAP
jgi:hypothetical protein